MTIIDTFSYRPAVINAVVATAPGTVDAETSFVAQLLPLPDLGPHDLLVAVRAVSVNPADAKVLSSFDPAGGPQTLGYDAAGVVVEVGAEVSAYAPGDEVYYAGSVARAGSNADHQLVDERIVGGKPASLDFAEAAAVPLTTITAWETLFDRMGATAETSGTILIMGGAGGVGSMLIQLARRLTRLTVIATASRPESAQWCRQLGAHHVVGHHDLEAEVGALAPAGVDLIFSAFSAGRVESYAAVLAPYGHVVAIDEPEGLDTLPLKPKSGTWTWELMFTRPLLDPGSTAQRELLDAAAALFDDGTLRTTLTKRLSPLDPETLREANRLVVDSTMIGKVVVEAETLSR